MVSFARARKKSWLSRLWPVTAQSDINLSTDSDECKKLIENQREQNRYFLEVTKNGGMWFS